MFRFNRLQLDNFRCFEHLDLEIEPDLTVLFAENGGGKSAILAALAMGIAVFQPQSPKSLKFDAMRDVRQIPVGKGSQREPAGPCSMTWTAMVDPGRQVQWELARNPASSRMTDRTGEIFDAIEAIRVPGARWPLFAWYGTDRLRRPRRPARSALDIRDRRAGYASSLDPTVNETLLLDTLLAWGMPRFVPFRKTAETDTPFSDGVCAAMVRAAPGVTKIRPGHPGMGGPVVWLENGQITPWAELSDGYHVFLALIGDIARRAVLLNETDGRQAPERIEGVVLIDEIDLHLHPRWQRVVIDGLRIPRLSGHRFHGKLDTQSAGNWTLIPGQPGHLFQGKLDT